VLEYSSEGRVVATGQPYSNRYISVVVIKDRKIPRGATTSTHCGSSPPSRDAPLNQTSQKRGDDQQATYSVDPLRKLIDGPLLLYGAQTTESQYRISHRARRNQFATSKSQRRVEARRCI
jgi:hypothetical protein